MSAAPGLAHPVDFFALVKPRITTMAVAMAWMALALAPGSVGVDVLIAALVGVGFSVGAANALNMYIERETDGLMKRTMGRPLPAGRMAPASSLAFGVLLAAAALVLLWFAVNPLTAGLAAAALANYVGAYTPLKRVTPFAVVIGAFSGAMPVLMGWTAVTGRVDPVGLVLFLVLFVWQIPHFLAISIFRKEEYDRASIRIVPTVRGLAVTKRQTVAYTTALVPLSLALAPLHGAGWTYVAIAVGVNAWFVGWSIAGLRTTAGSDWARGFFRVSLVYMPVLVLGLLIDSVAR